MSERIVNLRDVELEPVEETPDGHSFSLRSLGAAVGAQRTGLSVYELEPGNASWPYHFEVVEEEWLFVIDGELVLRTPEGERPLRTGDVACFPAGAKGAHAVRNATDRVVRYAMPSSVAEHGDACVYPDSGTFKLSTPDGFYHRGRLGDRVEYWEGEP
jgi:uncharacterized cupin superfamily protein